MEKSLSLKLAARKHTRYITWLSLAVLMFMFGSMIIVKNPKGMEAATLLPQALPVQVGNPMPIYDAANQKMYLVGGTDNIYYVALQSVDMTFGTSPVRLDTHTGAGGGTHYPTYQRAGPATVFNPITRRGYMIGGLMVYGDNCAGITPSITEVYLNSPIDTTYGLFPSKSTWFGGVSLYGYCPMRPSELGFSQLQLTIHSSQEDGYGDTSFTHRIGMSAAYDSDNQKAYIFGGRSGGDPDDPNDWLNEVFVLNTNDLASSPDHLSIAEISLTSHDSDLLGRRVGASSVFDPKTQKIYIFGGLVCVPSTWNHCANWFNLGGGILPSSDILEYDPSVTTGDRITKINHDSSIFTARVPMGVVMDEANGIAYIIGGNTGNEYIYDAGDTNDVIKFNTQSHSLIKTSKIGPAEVGFTYAFFNNAIYAFGGTSIYKIDLASGTTTTPSGGGVKIKKTLSAINRMKADGTYQHTCNSVIPNDPNCFNPYALQKGDIIKVELTITGASGTYSITDTPLKIPSGSGGPGTAPDFKNIKCDPSYAGHPALSDSTNGQIMPDGNVVWSNLSGTKTESYYCEVTSQ